MGNQTTDPRMLSVLRDRSCVGFIGLLGPKGCKAYDQAGKPLGYFNNEHDAAAAVYAAIAEEGQGQQ